MAVQRSLHIVSDATNRQVFTPSGFIPRSKTARGISLHARNDSLSGMALLQIADEYGRDQPATASALTSSIKASLVVHSGQQEEIQLRKSVKFIGTPILVSDIINVETTLTLEIE